MQPTLRLFFWDPTDVRRPALNDKEWHVATLEPQEAVFNRLMDCFLVNPSSATKESLRAKMTKYQSFSDWLNRAPIG